MLKLKSQKQNKIFLAFVYSLFIISSAQVMLSQNYENECKTILRLFESGKKDSAYALIEPLKKKAPYTTSVLYTRAQMTPDARAIGLYERIIALEPNGSYTEKALYQLVRRQTENRDSLAATLWLNALRERFPNSANFKAAETAYNSVTSWRGDIGLPTKSAKPEATTTNQGSGITSTNKPDGLITKTTTTNNSSNSSDLKATNTDKSKATEDAKSKDNTEKPKDKKNFITGIALQIGVFPTKDAANDALDKMLETYPELRIEALPKMVDGKKMYALITGPYKSVDAAKKSASALSGPCNCKPFPVNVE